MYYLLLFLFAATASCRTLTKAALNDREVFTSPVDNSEFIPQVAKVHKPSVKIEGNISFSLEDLTFDLVWADTNAATAYPQPFDTPERRVLTQFNFQYVTDKSNVYPVVQGLQHTGGQWDYILSPSKCWREETDGDLDRCVLVVAVNEMQQNCIYNGLLTFLVNPRTLETTPAWFQITNSYCGYYQFNTYGWTNITITQDRIDHRKDIIKSYEKKKPFPKESIEKLHGFVGTLDNNPFNNITDHERCSPSSVYKYPVPFYGVVRNGKFYTGHSGTRTGPHPYPESVIYPSYSTAKSNYAVMLAGALDVKGCVYPKTSTSTSRTSCILDLIVSDWIPEADDTWNATTVKHLLDQSTNHFDSLVYGSDEGTLQTNTDFFYSLHKLTHALYAYDYQPTFEPGSQFNYHSSNQYLASTIFEHLIQKVHGITSLQYYKDKVCDKLDLSDTYCNSLVSDRSVPFGGFGMFLYEDDIAKLTDFWVYSKNGKHKGTQIISERIYKKAMMLDFTDKGVLTERSGDITSMCDFSSTQSIALPNQRYSMGFWSEDLLNNNIEGVETTCLNGKLVFMSGYGGIRVMIAKNVWGYVQFGENYDFKVYRASNILANSLGCPQGLVAN